MLYRFLARLFFLQLEQVCSYLQSLCGPAVSRRGSYNLGRRDRRRMRLQIAELRVRRSRTRSADEERPVALCRITAREGHDDRHCESFASPQKNGNRLAGYGLLSPFQDGTHLVMLILDQLPYIQRFRRLSRWRSGTQTRRQETESSRPTREDCESFFQRFLQKPENETKSR